MAEAIIDARGAGYGMAVNPDGSINVSGIDITIGSLALALENVYVTSGNVAITEEVPIADNKNNPAWSMSWIPFSGTAIGIGSNVGSVTQFIDAGSYINILTYDASNNLTDIGSWV